MLTPMKSSAAISLFVRPCAASSATRRSVSVSSSEASAAAADPRELGAGLLRPEPCAQLFEDRKRLLERLAGCLLLLRLPAHGAEAEQGAAALERERRCVGQGGLEGCGRSRRVPVGGGEQAATARGAYRSTGAPQPPRVRLVLLQVGTGQLELAERDQGLDRVGPHGLRRVVQPVGKQPLGQLAQVLGGSLEVAERELQAAEHAERSGR